MMNDNSNSKYEYSENEPGHVHSLGKSYTGGPKGYGDPNDMTLRHVENFVHVTQIVKDRAHLEKCVDQIKKWGECMENAGYGSFITCKKQIDEMNTCLRHWYTDKDFRKECEQMYLEKRKKFRETGIIEKEEKPAYYTSSKKQKAPEMYKNESNSNESSSKK